MPERGFYYHYKHEPNGPINNYAYEVRGIARHTEDKSFFVLYIPLYETDWFKPADYQARPLSMWKEEVEWQGETMPRFIKINNGSVITELIAIRDQMYGTKQVLPMI